MEPDPSRRRAFVGLPQAVSDHVTDGSSVFIGNFGAQLHCVGHELIRQRLRDLHLIIGSGGILLDLLLGAGVSTRATFCHCWSPVGPVPAWRFRELAESGAGLELEELSVGTLTSALQAAAWGVPFAPTSNLGATAYVTENLSRKRLEWVETSVGNAWVAAALVPDVAFIHVDVADRDGNGVIRGPIGEAALAAAAAKTTVLVAEEIVGPDTIRSRSSETAIPGLLVDAVVELPGAVLPDGTAGRYDRDLDAYDAYGTAARERTTFDRWIANKVIGATDGQS